jgi:hypothetical protein
MLIAGGGGEKRVNKTVKAFFNDNPLRPPFGVPVTAKYTILRPLGGTVPSASLMDWGYIRLPARNTKLSG